MKKVLIDASTINVGGSIQVAITIIQNASKDKNFEWHLVCSNEIAVQIPTLISKGSKSSHILPLGQKFLKPLSHFHLSRIENLVKPDIVFTVFAPSYWRPKCPRLQGFALPLLVYDAEYCRNPNFKESFFNFSSLINKIKTRFVLNTDYLLVETETIKDRLCNKYNFPAKNVFVVENSYSPFFTRTKPKKERNRSGNIPPIIFVPSAYYPHKNLEIVPFVASELAKQKVDVKFRFLLDPSDAAWKRITALAIRLGVPGYLETIGKQNHEQMIHQYTQSSISFLPTLVEASTAVYPESFKTGVPLLTSDREFAHELCGNGALYFDPFDPSAAAGKIIKLLKDQKLRSALVKRGRKVLKTSYPTPEQKWAKTMKVLNSILKS